MTDAQGDEKYSTSLSLNRTARGVHNEWGYGRYMHSMLGASVA